MPNRLWLFVALTAALIVGCGTATAPRPAAGPSSASEEPSPTTDPAGPGLSKETALEVCKPAGERAFLARLRCADGSAPGFDRLGSVGSRNPVETAEAEDLALEQMFEKRPVGPGELDYHVIDLYEVACPEASFSIFLDMYHCGQPPPTVAPPGLVLEREPMA